MGTNLTAQDVLRRGQVVSCQLTRLGSNYTFVAALRHRGVEELAIYKPRDGEAPLWDFPSGTLYKREYAAYLLSEALGWNLVPFTIIRDGPHGVGSMQQFIDHDPRQTYYSLTTEDHADQLRTVCCFDLVANSTDRKANHLILENASGRLWSIDHGLTFHADTKIRTVIWDFCGEPIPEPLLHSLDELQEQLLSGDRQEMHPRLAELIELLPRPELAAFQSRLDWVLTERCYPGLPGRRRRRR